METTIEKESSFPFWRNLSLILIFFIITPIALGTSLFSLISLSSTQKVHEKIPNNTATLIDVPQSGAKVFASLPSSIRSVSGGIETNDARPELIRQYLAEYNSPLEDYALLIVETADKYGLDYRLLTAIGQQESNLCDKIPGNSHNCWGWGIHSAGTLMFDSYEEAIEIVSKGIKEAYIDKGYVSPEEIMSKYTPLSNGSWAFGVNKFMGDLE